MNVRIRRAFGTGTVALAVASSGCVVDGPGAVTGPAIDQIAFAPSLGIVLGDFQQTFSGLWLRDETVGEGASVQPGNAVRLSYSGWLPNGTLFDSSSGPDHFEVTIGVGSLIPGFDEGVLNMQVGGVRWLIIPPELAYGAASPGAIPANSFLIFKIELLEIPASGE